MHSHVLLVYVFELLQIISTPQVLSTFPNASYCGKKVPSIRLAAIDRTDDSRASEQSRSALPLLFRPDFLHCGINFNEYSAVTVGNSGAVLTERWSNIIPFPDVIQNSISALYSYRAPVQPALGPLCARCTRFICGV